MKKKNRNVDGTVSLILQQNVHTCACICTHMSMYIRGHTHTRVYTHIHTYTRSFLVLLLIFCPRKKNLVQRRETETVSDTREGQQQGQDSSLRVDHAAGEK